MVGGPQVAIQLPCPGGLMLKSLVRARVWLPLLIAIPFFQNCSGGLSQDDLGSTIEVQAKTSDFEVRGGRIIDRRGQSLRFTNLENVEMQSLTSLTVSGREVRLQVNNTASGRTATVRIALNNEGNFNGLVSAIGNPYMCLDQTKSACEMVTAGSSLVSNCSSPIRFDGSFTGGVNGLSANLSCTGTLAGIRVGYVAANVPLGCDNFKPETVGQLSTDVLEWMAEIIPPGLTRHQHWSIARTLGYNGELGQGGHSAYLAGDPARLTAFQNAVNAVISTPTGTGITLGEHYAASRAAGYKGVFVCGGHNCYLSGQCDAWGRRK